MDIYTLLRYFTKVDGNNNSAFVETEKNIQKMLHRILSVVISPVMSAILFRVDEV